MVGLIPGPLAELQFQRALLISQGDASISFMHPISLALLTIAMRVIMPILLRRRQRRRDLTT